MKMFIIITVMHCLLLVSTCFFLPKDFISKPGVAQDTEAGIELRTENNQTGACLYYLYVQSFQKR
jgi:hypothetical protein